MEKEGRTVVARKAPHALDAVRPPLSKVLLKHSRMSTYALEFCPLKNLGWRLAARPSYLALSANQQWIAIHTYRGLDIWDVRRQHFVRRIPIEQDIQGASAVFLQSDTALLTHVKENKLRLFELETGTPGLHTASFEAKLASEPALPIAPDRVVVTTDDGMIYCLNVPSLAIVWQTPFPLASPDVNSGRYYLEAELYAEENQLLVWGRNGGYAELNPSDGSLLFQQELPKLSYCGWLDADTVMLETDNRHEPGLGYTRDHWEQTLRPRSGPPRLLREKVPYRICAHFGAPGRYLAVKPDEAANRATSATIRSWQNGRVLMDVGRFSFSLHKSLLDWKPIRSAIGTQDTEAFRARLDAFSATFLRESFSTLQAYNLSHAGACTEKVLASVGYRRPQDTKPGFYLECYDLENGRCFFNKRLYRGYLSSGLQTVLSPDGRYLALKWGTVELFDVVRGESIAEGPHRFGLGLLGWTDISFVGFDAASEHFICSNGKVTNILRLDPFETLASLPYGQVQQYGSPILFSPDGKLLVSVDGGALAACNVADGQLFGLSGLDARVDRYGFSPDGRWIFYVECGRMVLCNGGTLAVENEAPLPLADVDSIHFSPDGREVWLTGRMDTEDGSYATIAMTLPGLDVRLNIETPADGDMTHGVGFINGGKRFVVRPGQGPTEFRDTENGNLCAHFHGMEANPAWFLHDGSNAFWAGDTSHIGVLKKDADTPDDPGKPVLGPEREAFVKDHNKRELVMAGVTGSPAYQEYLAVKEQHGRGDTLLIAGARPLLLEDKT